MPSGGNGAGEQLVLPPTALDTFPGPALTIGPDGAIMHGNEAGTILAAAMAADGEAGLAAACAKVIEGGAAGVETVVLPGANGPQTLECLLLPLADGVLVLGRNVTLDRNLRTALVESRQRYKDLVEISSDFAWETDAEGRLVFVSPGGALGYSADELVGRVAADLVVPVPGNDASLPFNTVAPVEEAEVWMRTATGGQACLIAAAVPLHDAQGAWCGARGVCRDVTAERSREAALARANNRERLLNHIVRTIRDVLDPADMLAAAAEAVTRAMGVRGCQIYRVNAQDEFALAASHGACGEPEPVLEEFERHDTVETVVAGWPVMASVSRHAHSINGGILVWHDGSRRPWSDDDRLLLDDVAVQIGIANEQIANHERIVTLSRTDALTGLLNRRAFHEELERHFKRLAKEGKPAALIYVDLDNFKLVNDVHGHQVGDEALLKLKDLLLGHTRPGDLVARLGGDEFAIWMEGAPEETAVGRCRRLLETGAELAGFSGEADKPLHMSIGIAVYDPARPETLDELTARADKAMYKVKRGGKADLAVADPAPGQGVAP